MIFSSVRSGRNELVELEPIVGGWYGGHDEQAHESRVGAIPAGQCADACHLRGGLASDVLEILGRHGAVASSEQDRPADLCRLDILAVDTALPGTAVVNSGRHMGWMP